MLFTCSIVYFDTSLVAFCTIARDSFKFDSATPALLPLSHPTEMKTKKKQDQFIFTNKQYIDDNEFNTNFNSSVTI